MRGTSFFTRRLVLVAGAIAIVVTGLVAWALTRNGPRSVNFTEAQVQRGDLLATVTATGTIEPEEVIDVGAQVVGIVQEFGRDPRDSTRPVDFGTSVEAGTILARIDDSLYRARLDKASSQVE